MTRVFLAAFAGALVVFVSSALLHMATPLGTMGLGELSGPSVQAMRDAIPGSGTYLFSDPQRGPYGFLAYTAGPVAAMAPAQLGMEFLSVFLAALIFALIMRSFPGTVLQRAILGASLAVFAWLSITASHWVWYRFATAFVAGTLLVEVIAWFLAGLVMAKIVR